MDFAASFESTIVAQSLIDRVNVSHPFEMYSRIGCSPALVVASAAACCGLAGAIPGNASAVQATSRTIANNFRVIAPIG
jgi:hypothetical protein